MFVKNKNKKTLQIQSAGYEYYYLETPISVIIFLLKSALQANSSPRLAFCF